MIKEKIRELWELRKTLHDIDEAYDESTKPLKVQRDALQNELIESMRAQGQYSARYDFCSVTISVRRTPHIDNENKIIQWLHDNSLEKEYTATRLTDSFDALMKQAVKEGKMIEGLSIRETEFISLRDPKENLGDSRNVIVE